MKSVIVIVLLGMGILVSMGCTQEVKNGNGAVTRTQGGEVRSVLGRWKMESTVGRGTGSWVFEADGTCILRDPGARERKGSYTYDGKELVLHTEHGSSRYEIIESREPHLKLFYRWGDSYDITISLTRLQ